MTKSQLSSIDALQSKCLFIEIPPRSHAELIISILSAKIDFVGFSWWDSLMRQLWMDWRGAERWISHEWVAWNEIQSVHQFHLHIPQIPPLSSPRPCDEISSKFHAYFLWNFSRKPLIVGLLSRQIICISMIFAFQWAVLIRCTKWLHMRKKSHILKWIITNFNNTLSSRVLKKEMVSVLWHWF